MISSEENPGLFTFMVGTIVVVLSGVGLSVLADHKMVSSSGNKGIRKEVQLLGEELEALTRQKDELSDHLSRRGPILEADAADYAKFQAGAGIALRLRNELLMRRTSLMGEIGEIEADFRLYRETYRRNVRADAVGASLGTLTLRGGRSYEDVVITRVTDVGLEIRHRDGIARVQAPELDALMQERFQWKEEDRFARLQEEAAQQEGGNQEDAVSPRGERGALGIPELRESGPSADRRSSSASRGDPVPKEQVQALRAQIVLWRTKVAKVDAEYREALSLSRSGGTSVENGLQTWKAKTAALADDLTKARAGLHLARERLRKIAPRDEALVEGGNGEVGG